LLDLLGNRVLRDNQGKQKFWNGLEFQGKRHAAYRRWSALAGAARHAAKNIQ